MQHVDEVLEASSQFSKDTEEKILLKMEASMKKREEQVAQLMERLRDHVSKQTNVALLVFLAVLFTSLN